MADSVPKKLKVDLEAPEVFVLVEVFKVRSQSKISQAHPRSNHSNWCLSPVSFSPNFFAARQSTCGVSVVRDYYKLKKFNVLEVASDGRKEDSKIGLAP